MCHERTKGIILRKILMLRYIIILILRYKFGRFQIWLWIFNSNMSTILLSGWKYLELTKRVRHLSRTMAYFMVRSNLGPVLALLLRFDHPICLFTCRSYHGIKLEISFGIIQFERTNCNFESCNFFFLSNYLFYSFALSFLFVIINYVTINKYKS